MRHYTELAAELNAKAGTAPSSVPALIVVILRLAMLLQGHAGLWRCFASCMTSLPSCRPKAAVLFMTPCEPLQVS